MSIRSRVVALAAVGGLALTACSSTTDGDDADSASDSAAFPATVKSCDEELTFDKAPSNVIMLGDTDASVLAELDLLDNVVGRAGAIREDAYDADTFATIEAIPEIDSSELDSGGAVVSTETILEARADLVIGYDPGVDRDSLRDAGIPFYSPDSFCENFSVDKASFDLVNEEVEKVAAIFGVPDKGEEVIGELSDDLADLDETAEERGSGAALYITPGSKTFYAYGTSSMVQPILQTNGLSNVYDDETERVFDASMEDLLKRDPDFLVLVYGDGSAEEAESTFETFNGVDSLKAVEDDRVLVLPMPLTDPPTSTSVLGAVTLGELLADLDG